MNIDTLNAYCRSVPVTDLPLSQGRLKLDLSVYSRRLHWLVQLSVGQFKMAPYAQSYYTKKLRVEANSSKLLRVLQYLYVHTVVMACGTVTDSIQSLSAPPISDMTSYFDLTSRETTR